MLGLLLGLGAALATSPIAPPAHGADASASWQRLGGGMEHRALANGGVRGHAFRFALAEVELRLVAAPGGRAAVEALAPRGDVIAVNASFFDEEGKAMGLAVDRGRSLAGARIAAWSALVVAGERGRIVRGSALTGHADADLVVQGLPRLVIDGAVPKLKPQRASRTVVCADGARLVLVVAAERVEAAELAQLLAAAPDAGGLGCRNALNLDGGPSTQLHARWRGFAADVSGGWGVPNALVATPRVRAPARP